MASATNLDKTLAKLRTTVESGAYYEAQQMYKTVYHRHRARRQLKESYQVLQDGALQQLKKQQVTCGVELGLLLIEGYCTDQVPAAPETVDAIIQWIHTFPSPTSASSTSTDTSTDLEECCRLVKAAVKWAEKYSTAPGTFRVLHDAFAQYLWSAYGVKQVGRAMLHFIRGSDAAAMAQVLDECSHLGLPQELDLWVLRAVLQVLAAASKGSTQEQLQYATAVSNEFVALQPDLDTPASHLTTFILQAIKQKSLDLVRLLKDSYESTLHRDESFAVYLTKIEQTYFNVSNDSGGLGGLLGSLFKSLGEMEQ